MDSLLLLMPLLVLSSLIMSSSGNFHRDFKITWGNGRAQIINDGNLLTLSLDKASGSGFQSKNEYLFGKIDMQLKLVAGNSAGTVTAYYVSRFDQDYFLIRSIISLFFFSFILILIFVVFSFPRKDRLGMRQTSSSWET